MKVVVCVCGGGGRGGRSIGGGVGGYVWVSEEVG